ncbi:MAG: rod shape-determining protein MreD [Lentimonas sp.]|jgi:rod shape-determining protein MreD
MPKNLKSLLALQLIAIFFATMNFSNIKIDYIADYLPFFDIMIIFYFTILRPQVFSIWFLFILGVIADSITGIPLGITSLIYIIVVKLFNNLNQKLIIKENFIQLLIKFAIFSFATVFMKWLFLSIYFLQIYNIINPLIQLFITINLYVFMHKLFNLLDKKLLSFD